MKTCSICFAVFFSQNSYVFARFFLALEGSVTMSNDVYLFTMGFRWNYEDREKCKKKKNYMHIRKGFALKRWSGVESRDDSFKLQETLIRDSTSIWHSVRYVRTKRVYMSGSGTAEFSGLYRSVSMTFLKLIRLAPLAFIENCPRVLWVSAIPAIYVQMVPGRRRNVFGQRYFTFDQNTPTPKYLITCPMRKMHFSARLWQREICQDYNYTPCIHGSIFQPVITQCPF